MSDDPYVDPESGVLRNLLGITDAEQLQKQESDLTYLRGMRLATERVEGNYDFAHLQLFHLFLFDGIYDWAGEPRTVTISRTGPFCLPQFIQTFAADLFSQLRAKQFLRGRDRTSFVDGLTHFLAEVNALHPFREGNGRAQRAFFAQLSHDAGYFLDWDWMDPETNAHASRKSFDGDNTLLRAMLDSLVFEYSE